VSPSKPVKRGPEPTDAQWRVINAALELFARHGVGGTSLRMIAKELGVTVAAVYHQYHAKEEIVFAAVESELRRVEAVVDAAEAEATAGAARDSLVDGMVELAVGGTGRRISAVLSDPIVTGSFDTHARFLALIPRMRRLLLGHEGSREPRIRTATLIAAITGTATHPFVADLDDASLRRELLQLAHALLPPLPNPEARLSRSRSRAPAPAAPAPSRAR
jgi:AcrR family transcriptional regulator